MLKAGYNGSRIGGWKGVLKNESGVIVWECLHRHHNRDQTTKASGVSAVDCARRATEDRIAIAARKREIDRLLANGGVNDFGKTSGCESPQGPPK